MFSFFISIRMFFEQRTLKTVIKNAPKVPVAFFTTNRMFFEQRTLKTVIKNAPKVPVAFFTTNFSHLLHVL